MSSVVAVGVVVEVVHDDDDEDSQSLLAGVGAATSAHAIFEWFSVKRNVMAMKEVAYQHAAPILFTLRESQPAHPKTTTLAKSTDYRDL